MPLGTALAHQDVACEHPLTAVLLHAEPPPRRVATVARRAACLLVCHRSQSSHCPYGGLATLAQAPTISLMRTVVWCWRWPRLRREFLRRRFLKAITLGARPCLTTSASTLAPATAGVPIRGSPSPASISTSANSIVAPASPATFSMVSTSSAATRYCLPP